MYIRIYIFTNQNHYLTIIGFSRRRQTLTPVTRKLLGMSLVYRPKTYADICIDIDAYIRNTQRPRPVYLVHIYTI